MTARLRAAASAAALACLGACSGGSDTGDLMASARRYIAQGDENAAIIQLKNVLQKQPDAAEARLLLGQASLQAGDALGAETSLRRALEGGRLPEQVEPILARALLAQGKTAQVIRDYADRRFADAAATADLKTTLAAAYGAADRLAEAQAAAEAALAAVPGYTPARLFQARLAARQGHFGDAQALLAQAAQAEPGNAEVWVQQGDVMRNGPRDLVAAEHAYRKAVELAPGHAGARIGLVSLLLERQALKEAAAETEALRKLPGQHATASFLEAQAAFQSGDNARALERVQQVLKAVPDSPSALQLAGAIELRSRNLLAAERSLAKALQLAPAQGPARQLLAQTYLRSGQPDKALATLAPLLSGPQPQAAALSMAGEAHLLAGDMAKAEATFKQAVAAEPDGARGSTRNRTALALLKLRESSADGAVKPGGSFEAALAELQQVAAADKGTYADMALVTVHLRSGDAARALEAIARIDAKQPERPDAAYLRGRVLLQQGRRVPAREAFEQALARQALYMPAVTQLVVMDLADRQPDRARERIDRVLAADKGNAQALIALAMLRERTGAAPEDIAAPLREAVARHPADAEARLRLIDFHLSRKAGKPALEAAQQAAAALPDSLDVLDALGRAQAAAGETAQAASTFNRIAATGAPAPQPYLRLAALALMQRDADLAGKHLRRALSIAPDLLEAQRMLMSLEVDRQRPDAALAIARTVQQQRPKEPTGFLWEADVQAARADAAGAVDVYRALLRRFDRTDAATRLHAALLKAQRQPEAEALARSWTARHADDAAFPFYLGSTALARQDWPGAAERFAQVLKLQPDHVDALNNLAWATARQGSPGAADYARQAVALHPGAPTLLDTLANALASEKKFDEAIGVQKQALTLAPGDPALRLGLAQLYAQSGDKAAARTELQGLAALGDRFARQAEVKRLLGTL